MTTNRIWMAAALMGLSMSPAIAVEQGDWLVRFGVGHVAPNDSSGDFSGAPGVGAAVGSSTRPTLNMTYMLTDHWGVDVLAAWPFEHSISAKGALNGKVGTTKQLPPTIGLQYHFMPKNSVRPYVGVGVNYTHFWDEDLNATGKAVLGSLELEDSVGIAGQLGVDMDLNKDWFVNADLRYMDLNTKGKTSNVGTVKVEIDPWVFIVGIGTRF